MAALLGKERNDSQRDRRNQQDHQRQRSKRHLRFGHSLRKAERNCQQCGVDQRYRRCCDDEVSRVSEVDSNQLWKDREHEDRYREPCDSNAPVRA